jgi:hypothetical protein
MKLKDLEDFDFFRLHPAGRVIIKTGIIHESKGHKCLVYSPEKWFTFINSKGNRVPVKSTGEAVYYPAAQNIYRVVPCEKKEQNSN